MPTAVGSAAIGLRAANDRGQRNPDAHGRGERGRRCSPAPTRRPSPSAAEGRFEITTAGRPEREISTDDPLPAGLTLTDHGDGTATLAGTATGRPGVRRWSLTAGAAGRDGHPDPDHRDQRGAGHHQRRDRRPSRWGPRAASPSPPAAGRARSSASVTRCRPAWSFADRGDGTAVISGTPTAPGRTTHGHRDRRERRGRGQAGTDGHRARATGDHQRDPGDLQRRVPTVRTRSRPPATRRRPSPPSRHPPG